MIPARRLWILGALFALLMVWDFASRPERDQAREALPLFEAFTADVVQRVEIRNPGMPEGQRELNLVKHSEGHWGLEGYGGFPVRDQLTESLVRGLAALTTLDLLSSDPASHERYGLREEQGVRITLVGAQEQVFADLLQGDLAPGGRARYVRRIDGDEVYRAPHFDQRAPAEWAPWVESRWMPFDRNLVQRIRVSGAGYTPALELKLKPGTRLQWENQAGEPVARTQVETLLTALARITLRDLEGPGVPAWNEAPGTVHFELELAGDLRWSGSLAGEPQAPEATPGQAEPEPELPRATVDRHGVFQVRLAPQACGALRRVLGKF